MKRILIGGGSGLIGQELSEKLAEQGYEVRLLSRSSKTDSPYQVFQWDIDKATIDPAAFKELDYVINLAGAGIADSRWSEARKQLIISSRVKTTELLQKYMLEGDSKIKGFVSASAIGYYGDAGEDLKTESDQAGTGFLSESTKAWEKAVFQTADQVPTAAIRIGIVSSTKGGALEKLLLPARFGVAPYFGDGRQWYSWIHLEDLCRMFIHLVENPDLIGVYNGVSPNPSRLKDLMRGIREAVGIPGLMFPVPEFLMRIPMGEMADVLFSSAKVSSKKIEDTGFKFEHPDLIPALQDLLDRKK